MTITAIAIFALTGCKTTEEEDNNPKAEFSVSDYRKAIRTYSRTILKDAENSPAKKISDKDYIDLLFAMVARKYFLNDQGEWIQSCNGDLDHIFGAFYRELSTHDRAGEPNQVEPKGIPARDDGSSLRHFFAAAALEPYWSIGNAAQRLHEYRTNPNGYPPDSYRDDPYAFFGPHFSHEFDTWTQSGSVAYSSKLQIL